MKINKIKIMNYRLLKNFQLDLEDELSLVVGKNNTGKTSVLYVLDKFINSSNTNFSWNDFSIKFREELIESVSSNNEYPYTPENFSGICLRIFIEYDSSDNLSNISDYMLDLDENNNNIILEFSYTISSDDFSNLIEDCSHHNDNMNF